MKLSTKAGIAGLAGLGAAATLAASAARAADNVWHNAEASTMQSGGGPPRDGWPAPEGIRVGNFLIQPDAGVRTYFRSDKQEGTPGRTDTMQYEASVGLDVRSDLPRHFFALKLEGRALSEQGLDNLTTLGGSARMVGRYDIDHSMSLNALASALVQQRQEQALDADRVKGASTPYASATYGAEINFKRTVGHLDTSIGSRLTQFSVLGSSNTDPANAGAQAGDTTIVEPFARVGWTFSPGYRAFTEVAGRFQTYSSDAAINRDAQGFQALGGVEFLVTPLVKAMIKGGYFELDFASQGVSDIKTYVYEGRLDWSVSPLVNIGFGTKREVVPTSYGDASGRVATSYTMHAGYEMWRNLTITAEAGLRYSDYVGDPRADEWWMGKVGFDYILNQNWVLSLSYEHQALTSNVAGLDHSFDRVMAGVRWRY
ncbi:MAG: outer membrane beta-barrel protein [Proteobacteria bacterium]|nr:outer membrane beta-barrel protein [Pseudomonadota bacterium]